MQNYGDWKTKNSSSAILEALNRGSADRVSTFGSVDQFISGILGSNFIKDTQNQVKPPFSSEIIPDAVSTEPRDEEILANQIVQDEESGESEEEEYLEHEEETNKSSYKIYRDKEEIFECNISVQGAKLSSSQIRLVFDHEICNLVFYGKINKDGKCVVPLKKMNFYPENSTGRVRLEVIVDDTIFIPWEETFIVEGAKKVTVQIKSQKKVDFRF
jgi:hypothetical protein